MKFKAFVQKSLTAVVAVAFASQTAMASVSSQVSPEQKFIYDFIAVTGQELSRDEAKSKISHIVLEYAEQAKDRTAEERNQGMTEALESLGFKDKKYIQNFVQTVSSVQQDLAAVTVNGNISAADANAILKAKYKELNHIPNPQGSLYASEIPFIVIIVTLGVATYVGMGMLLGLSFQTSLLATAAGFGVFMLVGR